MAEFQVFSDDNSAATAHSSSVHAVNELYRTANEVYRLHEERKNLAAGLKTAEARLRMSSLRTNTNQGDEDGEEVIEYDDYGGLGFIGSMDEEGSRAVDELLERMYSREDERAGRPDVTSDEESRFKPENNYGLGTYGAFSSIPDLAREVMIHLEPYYDADYRGREEYEAEMASYVALRLLECYAAPSEVAEALLRSSAVERLMEARVMMRRHVEELRVLADRRSVELRDCGEECTDLW